MSDSVFITDVAPRDGLQSEVGVVPTVDKAGLVRAIGLTGVSGVEVSSFVSPRWVPQLGDAGELLALLGSEKPEGVVWSALVPNERGMAALLGVNERARSGHGVERLIDQAAVFTAASESFSQRNTNATIAETLERFEPVVELAGEYGIAVRGYVSCVVACPFEGAIEPGAVGEVVSGLLSLGVDEIDLGDTIGAATPETIEPVILETIDRLESRGTNRFGRPTLTLHLHDTHGRAAECVLTAIDLGVRSFDASAGGLGGCPYASTDSTRAPGNISMRTLVEALELAGLSTGVDRSRLAVAEATAARVVQAARMEAAGEGGAL